MSIRLSNQILLGEKISYFSLLKKSGDDRSDLLPKAPQHMQKILEWLNCLNFAHHPMNMLKA